MNIYKLKISDILGEKNIYKQQFEYAGVEGIAQIYGWQILSFARKNNLDKTVAILLNELDNKEIIDIANTILRFTNIKVTIGDNLNMIKRKYGKEYFIDIIYETIIRYNYLLLPDIFIAFGFMKNILCSVEIVNDKEIIENIVIYRKI